LVEGEGRAGRFPRFESALPGQILERNLALVDAIKTTADAKGVTVAQIAIAWVLSRGDDIGDALD
jgi:aryl-alcohol dehydrogenase-like predicted oxidoreductase